MSNPPPPDDDHDNDDLPGIRGGWGRRLLSTGRIAASAARLAARRVVGAKGAEDGLIGEALARELDQMKGMAMKVGQILSYFEGVLPDATHEALRTLQLGAKPVAFEVMRRVIEEAFGEPLDALFDDFERTAVASASIGQVYRARLRGEPVAVKVQYPGIEQTIRADFSRLGQIAGLASLATAVDGAALVSELRERFAEECDYEREAASQRAFSAALSGDPDCLVPGVFDDRTRRTVLTTRWHDGRDFYGFVEHSDEARRTAAGLVLTRFAYRSLFQWGTLNADPHPGNYLFPERGPIVLLDFGCVKRFTGDFVEGERRLAQVVLDDRRGEFRDALVATGVVPNPDRFDFDLHWELLCHQYAPYRAPRFRFTFDYIRAGSKFSGPSNPNLRRLAIPPPWIWVQRLQWGLHAVLARLGADGAFRDVLREALAGKLAPLQSD